MEIRDTGAGFGVIEPGPDAPRKETIVRPCGTCDGHGKLDGDVWLSNVGDPRTVECWKCGGTGATP